MSAEPTSAFPGYDGELSDISEMSGLLLSHQECRVTGALFLGVAEPRGVAVSRFRLLP
jgi:hypothetical protein